LWYADSAAKMQKFIMLWHKLHLIQRIKSNVINKSTKNGSQKKSGSASNECRSVETMPKLPPENNTIQA
jgi:hypothetical protein